MNENDLILFGRFLTSIYEPVHNTYGRFHQGLPSRINIHEWTQTELVPGLFEAFFALRPTDFKHTPENEQNLVSCLFNIDREKRTLPLEFSVLQEIVNNWNGIWIRHGKSRQATESSTALDLFGNYSEAMPDRGYINERGSDFWPNRHWAVGNNLWSVEVGDVELVLTRGTAFGDGMQLFGLLPLIRYEELQPNAEMVFAHGDHLMLSGDIPLSEWIFIYGPDALDETLFSKSKGNVPLELVRSLIKFFKTFLPILETLMLRLC